jgi:hypothetical protein
MAGGCKHVPAPPDDRRLGTCPSCNRCLPHLFAFVWLVSEPGTNAIATGVYYRCTGCDEAWPLAFEAAPQAETIDLLTVFYRPSEASS